MANGADPAQGNDPNVQGQQGKMVPAVEVSSIVQGRVNQVNAKHEEEMAALQARLAEANSRLKAFEDVGGQNVDSGNYVSDDEWAQAQARKVVGPIQDTVSQLAKGVGTLVEAENRRLAENQMQSNMELAARDVDSYIAKRQAELGVQFPPQMAEAMKQTYNNLIAANPAFYGNVNLVEIEDKARGYVYRVAEEQRIQAAQAQAQGQDAQAKPNVQEGTLPDRNFGASQFPAEFGTRVPTTLPNETPNVDPYQRIDTNKENWEAEFWDTFGDVDAVADSRIARGLPPLGSDIYNK